MLTTATTMVTNDEYYDFSPSVRIALTESIPLNEAGLEHRQDAGTGEQYMVYRIRDMDFRGRRIGARTNHLPGYPKIADITRTTRANMEDSNENTRSFGICADMWKFDQVCQSSLFLGGAEGTTREFVYACATDPILARLLFIASLMVYLITRMDAFFVVPEVLI
ncbi:hypothetical protein K466DRAFT_612823 [Polyporus arcularius HHB13444]|uniref:Uncharacterized protein n=1 Tax=Polyporus arcularius HHB13444 TaxID=1314778 RepID=A0A5C3PWB9_9APHY|nr:hypothetical protein K466DRAFT_612823 [Polyporus arcularius HHB13444]